MPDLLKDKVAVVTGAGRGVGRAEAIALAAQGAKVVVNDLGVEIDGSGASKSPADDVVAEIKANGGEAAANYDSVALEEGAENIIKTALDNYGRIDILVNNAGILRDRMVFNMTPEEFDLVVKVNLYGTFYCTHYASAKMRQQQYGRIISTTSHSALGNIGQSNYSAAKEGVVGFTRTIARELGRYGITCNAIRPRAGTRLTMTEQLKEALIKKWGEEEGLKHARQMEETMRPEGVASLVVYLASEQADYVNGCIFEVWSGHIGIYNDPPKIEQVLWKDGNWLPEELIDLMPKTLTRGKVRELPASAEI